MLKLKLKATAGLSLPENLFHGHFIVCITLLTTAAIKTVLRNHYSKTTDVTKSNMEKSRVMGHQCGSGGRFNCTLLDDRYNPDSEKLMW